MNIKPCDVDYNLGYEFRFKREDLNYFCNNHPFTMFILASYKYRYMNKISNQVDSKVWNLFLSNEDIRSRLKAGIQFDNPDDELMFKLIY